MAARLTSAFPRIVALTAILVLGTATISFAAESQFGATATPNEVTVAAPELVSVPDVRGQAYVFAKGTLEEAGFAWRVVGPVQGYPANTVISQTPAAGTRLVDTGMPTIELGLSRNGSYVQEGTPENASPYDGTAVKLPGRAKPASKPKPAAKPKAKPKPKTVAKPKPKPAAKPKPRPKPKLAARPAAFNVAGAPAEPLDEMPLPARAERLERWLRAHPKPTNANVRYWLFQHEWIVTGARFGWWHGAEALEILIRVDEQAQRQWKLGAKSEAAARRALAAVRAKSR
ncbi:MAG TPA: PASTA domain-containing protein [Gaiellaceae bacterium]|nr:PASTA domain-containing protein [Gaiellaceae bacterium]